MNKASAIWLKKIWNNSNNKDLCYCVAHDQSRFKLIPAAIFTLDHIGLNDQEIINLDSCLDVKFGDLSRADIDMLNDLEARYNILFNGEEKLRFNANEISVTTMLRAKLNNVLYNKHGNEWHGCALLFSQSAYDYALNKKAA